MDQAPPETSRPVVPPVKHTSAGPIVGKYQDGSAVFLGVPYAAAPAGPLRFAAPLPPRQWSSPRDCTEHGPTPLRANDPYTLVPSPAYVGDETLNANVFLPTTEPPSGGYPVLVWVHGGGFNTGSIAAPWFTGQPYNRNGIAVVMLSYRLGFAGFGWVEDAPENRGILDLAAGLRWVHENADTFGWNADKVTLAGHSAGATCVLHLLEEHSNLMAQGIAQSPLLVQNTAQRAEEAGREFAEQLGIRPTTEQWSSLPEEKLNRSQHLWFSPQAGLPRSLADHARQILSKEIVALPFSPYFRQRQGCHVPLLLGTTAHEYTSLSVLLREPWKGDSAKRALTFAGLPAEVATRFIELNSSLDWEADRVAQLLTEILFRVPTLEWADTHRGPTWMYDFRWISPTYGLSVHASELPFVWDRLGDPSAAPLVGESAPQQLADEMQGALSQFILTGNPGWDQWDGHNAHVFTDSTGTVADSYAASRLLANSLRGV